MPERQNARFQRAERPPPARSNTPPPSRRAPPSVRFRRNPARNTYAPDGDGEILLPVIPSVHGPQAQSRGAEGAERSEIALDGVEDSGSAPTRMSGEPGIFAEIPSPAWALAASPTCRRADGHLRGDLKSTSQWHTPSYIIEDGMGTNVGAPLLGPPLAIQLSQLVNPQ
jgi:hypothetical protein